MLTYRQSRARLLQISDGLLFALSLGLAYVLRAHVRVLDLPTIETFAEHLWLFPVVAIIGPAALASQGFYELPRLASRLRTIFVLTRGVAFTGVALVLLLFLLRLQFARSVIMLAGVFGGVLVYLRHELMRQLTPFGQSPWRQRVLWVGLPDETRRLRDALTYDERASLESISEFDPRTESVDDLTPILHDYSINVVVITLTGLETTVLAPVLATCEREGVAIVVRPGLLPRAPLGMTIDWFAGEPVIHYHAQSAHGSHLVLKQAFDYAGSAILLLLLSPCFLAIMIAVKASSRGPIFFAQARAGLNGRPFRMLKFRSMRVGAERERATLAPLNEMTGPVFKVTNDPRVTGIGRFLRKHSLDELPQLWNVLRGEMSLVGPRPLPLDEVKKFSDDAHRRRLSVRPGLTCLWQISGRNDITDFADWVRLDLAYIDQWSLWLDLRILLTTIPVVIFGRGGR